MARDLRRASYGQGTHIATRRSGMSRKHRFPLVVMLAAAIVAGLFAVTRTVQLGAAAKPASSAQVATNTRSLDRLEAKLRRQLAALPKSTATAQGTTRAPTLVYVRRAASPITASQGEGSEPGSDDLGVLGAVNGDD
jgi:preprotein translocase subunit SecF